MLGFIFESDSARIQTLNLLIRSQVLYSVELRNHSLDYFFCTPLGIRTLDPLIKSQLLYQLS